MSSVTIQTKTPVKRKRKQRRPPNRGVAVILPGSQPSNNKTARAQPPILRHTQAGSEWLRKYLNPNGEVGGNSTQGKVPDGSTKRSGLFNIHATNSFSTPFTSTDNWTLFSISTNTIFCSHIHIAQASGSDYVAQDNLNKLLNALNINGSDVLNQWIGVKDTNPQLALYYQIDDEFEEYAAEKRYPNLDFIKIRQTYKGTTYRYAGSTLNDEGEVIVGKYPVSVDNISLPIVSSSRQEDVVDGIKWPDDSVKDDALIKAVGDVTGVIRSTFVSVPILSAQSITTADQGAYAGRASDGCYSVNYNTDSVFPWHTVGDFRKMHYTTSFSSVLAVVGVNKNPAHDIVSPLWEVGVVIFSNLSPSAVIQQESRRGVEFVSSPGGMYQSLQESSPSFDPVPVNLSKAIAMNMKSGYPSAYNDWGGLWKVIKTVIPSVAGMIPGVGGFLGSIAKPAVDYLDGVFNPPKATVSVANKVRPVRKGKLVYY